MSRPRDFIGIRAVLVLFAVFVVSVNPIADSAAMLTDLRAGPGCLTSGG